MTRKRGFASMDANRQREIASKGGRAAHEKGTAHEVHLRGGPCRRPQGRASRSFPRHGSSFHFRRGPRSRPQGRA